MSDSPNHTPLDVEGLELLAKEVARCGPWPGYSTTTVELTGDALLRLLQDLRELVEALRAVEHWASRRCPCGPPDFAPDEPAVCPLCDARVDVPGDRCKAVEAIFPRPLLAQTRALLTRIAGQ